MHIKVCNDSFKVEVIEMSSSGESSEIRIHNTPILELHHNVIPSSTRVSVFGSGITVKIVKERQEVWPQLCRQKFNWVKIDPDSAIVETEAKVEETKAEVSNVAQVCRREVEYECNIDETDPGTTDSESCDENEIEEILL